MNYACPLRTDKRFWRFFEPSCRSAPQFLRSLVVAIELESPRLMTLVPSAHCNITFAAATSLSSTQPHSPH